MEILIYAKPKDLVKYLDELSYEKIHLLLRYHFPWYDGDDYISAMEALNGRDIDGRWREYAVPRIANHLGYMVPLGDIGNYYDMAERVVYNPIMVHDILRGEITDDILKMAKSYW